MTMFDSEKKKKYSIRLADLPDESPAARPAHVVFWCWAKLVFPAVR